MAYKNKTYIAFDGDNDIHYYRLMQAWSKNEKFNFEFHNAHDLNSARDTSLEQSIKRQLRERFANSKAFIILIGDKTRYLRKFVEWEIETAVNLNLPIIAINLNGSREVDNLCPPSLKGKLAMFTPFNEKIITHALNGWPASHAAHVKKGETGAYHYITRVYESYGL